MCSSSGLKALDGTLVTQHFNRSIGGTGKVKGHTNEGPIRAISEGPVLVATAGLPVPAKSHDTSHDHSTGDVQTHKQTLVSISARHKPHRSHDLKEKIFFFTLGAIESS